MEETLKQILNELKEIKTDIHDLKDGQARLGVGQNKAQKNLIDSLGSYNENS
ncbi:hypothetical protein [Bacillus sp. es.034]|uniref:hypothetical protein n=1 Tax=Bacillus sp. es.034 TaxID=1761763 RepID=UPI0015CF3984|nr:hypothetical protein [Bacillus sp. es.034]